MRTDHHHFTIWVQGNDHAKIAGVEPYDHQDDPQENTNVAAVPANAALVERLMTQWRAGWKGALPRS